MRMSRHYVRWLRRPGPWPGAEAVTPAGCSLATSRSESASEPPCELAVLVGGRSKVPSALATWLEVQGFDDVGKMISSGGCGAGLALQSVWKRDSVGSRLTANSSSESAWPPVRT